MGGTKEKRKRFLASSFGIFGSPSWARTSDLRINSPSLYRSETLSVRFLQIVLGSPSWARTSDLRINSPSLYRLSYRGIKDTKYISSIRKKQGSNEK